MPIFVENLGPAPTNASRAALHRLRYRDVAPRFAGDRAFFHRKAARAVVEATEGPYQVREGGWLGRIRTSAGEYNQHPGREAPVGHIVAPLEPYRF